MEIEFESDHDKRIDEAYRALDELMDLYGVDICADGMDYWFEVRERREPELRVV